jgi:hypothetical protein
LTLHLAPLDVVFLHDAPGDDARRQDCLVGPGVALIIGFFLDAGDELQMI